MINIYNFSRWVEINLDNIEGMISAEEIAEKSGTLWNELACHITRRVPQVYIKGGRGTKVINYMEG